MIRVSRVVIFLLKSVRGRVSPGSSNASRLATVVRKTTKLVLTTLVTLVKVPNCRKEYLICHFQMKKTEMFVSKSTQWVDHLRGRYAALSHRWGNETKPIITTTENVDAHISRIPFSDLSTSFQDAVRPCRQLSVPYLWIDTLCIIQDSLAD